MAGKPDEYRVWIGITRDAVLVLVGAFMLVFEVFAKSPNPLLVGAGLTALGLPSAIRLDMRSKNDAP